MEQVRRIELPSQPWQGRILTIVLHLQINYIVILSLLINNNIKKNKKYQVKGE